MPDLDPNYFNEPLSAVDPEIADALHHELERQQNTLEMIASENFVPRAILEAAGSVLTNKYAEGCPGKRYYGGCEWVDVSEQLAIDRAKELFGAEHANVQPHAGAQANNAVYMALLDPGDTILGMELAHGGHLTHGMKLNVSGKLYEVAGYQVRKDDYRVDMEQVERLAKEHRPKVIVAGWSAYPRHLDFAEFRRIADEVGAKLFVDMAHFAGLVAAGEHPSPVPHADVVTHHHAQDARRPARRPDPLQGGATRRRSTRPCSPASRAARSSTSSPRRRCACGSPRATSSASASARRSPTRAPSARRCRRAASTC